VVGTQIATGVPLDDLYRRLVASAAGPHEKPPDLGPLLQFFAARAADGGPAQPQTRPTPEVLAWIGGQARAASTKMSAATRIKVIKDRLPVHEWPERRLQITAIDTANGSLVVWERAAGVPLPLAVASSCAVPWIYPPVTINGRRYMDGGVRSATNADLAAGHDVVLVIAPTAGLGSAVLDDEMAQLCAAGARVAVIAPDAPAMDAIGPNPLDPARRAAAAEAGLAQARTAAGALDEVRPHLTV